MISSINSFETKKNKLVEKKDQKFIEKQNIDDFMLFVRLEKIAEIQFTYKGCIKKINSEYSLLNEQYDISSDSNLAILKFNRAVDMLISEAIKESSGPSLDALYQLSQLRQEFSLGSSYSSSTSSSSSASSSSNASSNASTSSSPRLSSQQGIFFNISFDN